LQNMAGVFDGGGGSCLRRAMSAYVTYLVFVCTALVWTWVLPIWQGPDESAHFSYVQYMMYHPYPPKVAIVPAGKDPWEYGASKSAVWSKALTGRNWVLSHPNRYLRIAPARRYDVLRRIHALSTDETNVPQAQNYVGIYPPLYYGIIGKALRCCGVQDIHHQAYLARLWSVFLFGWCGVVSERLLRHVAVDPMRRVTIACTVPFLFPTLSMLGGVVNNDVLMDGMSIVLFGTVLDACRREVWTNRVACMYGVILGISFQSKPEVYVFAALAAVLISACAWRRTQSVRATARLVGIAASIGLLIAAPWFALTLCDYHTLIPPLTYQAEGGWPRNFTWFAHHLLLSRVYEMHLMVVQIVSGMNYPWWRRPVASNSFYALWGVLVSGLFYVGGLRLLRRDRLLFWISLTWLLALAGFLWYAAYHYLLQTGSNFIQGRYFFAVLPVFIYCTGMAIRRQWVATCLLVAAVGVYVTVVDATVFRYYHSTLWQLFLGNVVTYDPAAIILAGQLSLVTLALVLARMFWRGLRRTVNGQ